MKNRFVVLGMSGLLVLFSASFAPIHAATLCVWTNSPTPGPPYNAWTNAARTIQAAVDAATAGDTVLVTNGVYANGGATNYPAGTALTNRVAIYKAIAVRSVNGPSFTTIRGAKDPLITNGPAAIRCVYMMNGASLVGFTLTNGATMGSSGSSDYISGGGVWCQSTNAVISNCTLTGNSAGDGGGVYGGTLYNCVLTGNSAGSGGGASDGTLYNCTLSGNSAGNGGGASDGKLYNCVISGNSAGSGGGAFYGTLNNCTLSGNSANYYGGGVSGGTLYNCIVYYNTAPDEANYYNSLLNYSCTTPDPVGTGNITTAPKLLTASHISINSPCVGAGSTNYSSGKDIDGQPWRKPPAMGCDEPTAPMSGPFTVAVSALYSNVARGWSGAFLQGNITGIPASNRWSFGDGKTLTNQSFEVGHAWANTGLYTVVLTAWNSDNPGGVSATVQIRVVEGLYYVRASNPTPISPYTNWQTAATNIQAAVDVACAGGAVLVSNGVYSMGSRVWPGDSTSNRVVITNMIAVRSVNGSAQTFIVGTSDTRCVYMTAGALLSGFTLTNGNASGFSYGGGVYADDSAVISNCVLIGNSAYDGGGADGGALHNCTLSGNSARYSGGGVYQGTLYNCTLTGNSADWGGGAYGGMLYNCTLTGNSANYGGGGAMGGTLYNCIVYYNTAPNKANYYNGLLTYSCTTPAPEGVSNITNAPLIASFANPRLLPGSPCINAGTNQPWMTGATDWAGRPRINTTDGAGVVDIGACEFYSGVQTGALTAAASANWTNVATGFAVEFTASTVGECLGTLWQFGDGQSAANAAQIRHAFAAPGVYAVVLRASNLTMTASATVTVQVAAQSMFYVSPKGAHVPPFATWVNAATTIQAAVDTAYAGGTVWVTNGAYTTGGRTAGGQTLTNRVTIHKPITVRSVNGPSVTIIQGAKDPITTNGNAAVRCVWMTNGASLIGFILTNGATRNISGADGSGGGVWCQSVYASVSNCTLSGNSASSNWANYGGGGAYGGTLYNCTLTGNTASQGGGAAGNWQSQVTLYNCTLIGNTASQGGGASYGTLNNCTLSGNSASQGGGAIWGTLNNCILSDNSARLGGGAYGGTLYKCTLSGNSSSSEGGGAAGGTLNNCMLTGNSANWGGGAGQNTLMNNCTLTGNSASNSGGGASGSTLNNCIVYYNTAHDGENYDSGSFNYSCTMPDPGGIGNITAAPLLLNASHIASNSPCVGAGSAGYATGVDIDGNPWRNPPAMGCDEPTLPALGPLTVAISSSATNAIPNYPVHFMADIQGIPVSNRWTFGDGGVLTNRAFDVSHAWATTGLYAVVLRAWNDSNPGGVSATVMVRVFDSVYYVNVSNATPASPYGSWATAATNIQDAVDAAAYTGSVILVTNGVYGVGGRPAPGCALTNRVTIAKVVTVRSVNGPAVTIIQGAKDPATMNNGPAAIRCVWMTNGASLIGFTLTNGATMSIGPSVVVDDFGGGIWCQSTNAVISNCVLTGNSAYFFGGGANGGTLYNCTLTGNSATLGGGAYGGTLYNCMLSRNWANYGGGAAGGTLYNCTLTGNSAGDIGGGAGGGTLYNCTLTGNSANHGGGASYGTLNNCILTGNSARYDGGGARDSTLYNCTLTGNSASNAWGGECYGGGVYGGTQYNCIVYYNTAPDGANYTNSVFNYSCTTPDPGGAGNIANNPQFVSVAHIAANSPCVGAGSTNYATGTDIDGNPWRTPPAMGCDEPTRPATGTLTVAISASTTNIIRNYTVQFMADIQGIPVSNRWTFGDGVILTNQVFVDHTWATTGLYAVVVRAWNDSNPGGVSATVQVRVVSDVYYVRLSNATPSSPYDSWAKAATNIQAAVDVAPPGALILVSNGVYSTGGRTAPGSALTNRVVVDKAITVRSVNGAAVTVIVGAGPLGDAAVRCVYLGTNATLSGFTLTNGCTQWVWADVYGGGVFCESGAVVSNCVLIGNSAFYGGGTFFGTLYNCVLTGNSALYYGGGVYYGTLYNCALNGNSAQYYRGGGACGGTLNNCTLSGNSASYGGGVYDGMLNNCTLSGNSAYEGGGADGGTLYNCIVWNNAAPMGANWYAPWGETNIAFTCTTPLPGGAGNIANNPQFVSVAHIAANSPCVGTGNSSYASGTDIDGNPWRNPPAMGCNEPTRPATGTLTVAIGASATNVVLNYAVQFMADIQGIPVSNRWTFGDGGVLTNRAFEVSHAWATTGLYAVVLRAWNDSNPGGVSATVQVRVARGDIYVNMYNASPSSPYDSWAKAATNIQDAVDAAPFGSVILVSNGVYSTGGRPAPGSAQTNRVTIVKAMTVRSVNGPVCTVIDANLAGRCMYVGAPNVLVDGFTLTNGIVIPGGEDDDGGGIYLDYNSVVQNCIIAGNAANWGGGVCVRRNGQVRQCRISGNRALWNHGGGISMPGGGSLVDQCFIQGNSATYGGGIVMGGKGYPDYGPRVLRNCVVADNTAFEGGGVFLGQDDIVESCTIVSNSATHDGGGVSVWGAATLVNSILYNNACANGPNYSNWWSGATYIHCCTFPPIAGPGNITNNPKFVSTADYRLMTNSPCINTGTNQDWWMIGATDLDGNPRIRRERADMGAYESDYWGMNADVDGDGFTDYTEAYLTGTDPTNPLSFLGMSGGAVQYSPAATGIVVRWQSVGGKRYRLERSTNLLTDPFRYFVRTNIPGAAPMNTETDKTAVGAGPWLYRIRLTP